MGADGRRRKCCQQELNMNELIKMKEGRAGIVIVQLLSKHSNNKKYNIFSSNIVVIIRLLHDKEKISISYLKVTPHMDAGVKPIKFHMKHFFLYTVLTRV